MDATLEAARVKILEQFGVMDTGAEASYDQLTSLAAEMFAAPIAVVTLLDRDRQWFKSKIGLDISETPRDIAFCHYAIQKDGIMIVPETLEDERFRNNPLVTDDPKVRFYAGVPLITKEGIRLGTLCVLDTKPRHPSAREISVLERLSYQVMEHLEARRSSLFFTASNKTQADEIEGLRIELAKVQWLEGLITICSNCKQIKDDEGLWSRIETYIQANSNADFSHGICPDCRTELYPELSDKKH